MSDKEDISQSTTFGTIGFLANNNPLVANPNEPEQPEPKSNEIITNIIKDSSNVSNQENEDFDDDEIQKKMNGLINDLQSESITPDDQNLLPRKSITSGHLIDNQENTSAPVMIDSSSNNPSQGPIRSMSESILIDHHDTSELPSTLPVQQDENSTDEDDFDGIQTNNIKQNSSDAKARVESSSSKRSASPSGDEKRVQFIDETDTDRDNQEVAAIARRPSRSKSPLNRPPSPTPDDSRKTLTNDESKRPSSSSYNDNKEEQKQIFEPPTAIISPASRRESTNKTDQQQTSRPSSTTKSNSFESANNNFLTTNEQSKLIKPGEQLQIPTNDINNERLNSPPPSPSTTKQTGLTSPLLRSSFIKTDQDNSRPPSQTNRKSLTSTSVSNEKVIDGDIISSKSRRSSNTSQKQQTDQKSLNKKDSRRSSKDTDVPVRTSESFNKKDSRRSSKDADVPLQTSESFNKKDSRRSSTDADVPLRTSAKQNEERILSNDKRRSPSQKQYNITTDETVITPIKIGSSKSQKRSSMTDSSENERKLPPVNSSSRTTTPAGDKQTNHWTKQAPIPPIQTTDDEIPSPRPQSPNVEQIAQHNPPPKINKKRNIDEQKKKDQHRLLRRSNSAESFNHIPLVDDKSLDSTSGNNTESDISKQRRVRSKKKDMETNTDSKNYLHNGNHQQQESTSQKPLKITKSMPDHPQSIRRRIPAKDLNITTPDTEPDSNIHTVRRTVKKTKDLNEDKDPVNVNVTVLVKNLNNEDDDDSGGITQKPKEKKKSIKSIIDNERHTQSDTEQIITEKQKKRRRPKRISRTTQTYECVFRRMEREREEHEELRPISDLDKTVQTRKSCLRPTPKSPKKHFPVYLSSDAFKIEEILPKQFPHSQRNISKMSTVARSNSPPSGKLLILRPTLPFHHTDAVNVQRVNLQYAIDLIPNENKPHDSTVGQRNKPNALKQSEQINNLPIIHSTQTPANKSNAKDKSVSNRIEDRNYQRKDGNTV